MNKIGDLAKDSKVWIYQSNRTFSEEEVKQINLKLEHFTKEWAAHNVALKSFGKVYHNIFIVLMVDESHTNASGCSIDTSVHFIQSLEKTYNVNLFDRFCIAYKKGNDVELATKEQFQELINNGIITSESIVYNNMVQTKAAFEKEWEATIENSWHKKVFSIN